MQFLLFNKCIPTDDYIDKKVVKGGIYSFSCGPRFKNAKTKLVVLRGLTDIHHSTYQKLVNIEHSSVDEKTSTI